MRNNVRPLVGAIVGAVAALAIGVGSAQAATALDGPSQNWSFSGVFGKFDMAAAQRGLQVYKEVCSSCHGLDLMHYRNLTALGYSEEQVKAFASQYEVTDGPNDDGEFFTRPAEPKDRFVSPFSNKKEAAAANGGKAPPDLTLMVKARAGGADYLYNLLTGYHDEPTEKFQEFYGQSNKDADGNPLRFELPDGAYFNEYFAGGQIAMANPLFEDGVEYTDGTPATVEQMARDVTTFLAWTAEPELEQRKGMGHTVFIFLIVFLGLAIANKKRLWAQIK